MVTLGGRTWPDVERRRHRPVVAVPVGSCEQHGPHLPLDTDTRIAVALARRLAAAMEGEVVVAPPLAVTASGEHGAFPGTLSIGLEVMEQVVVELVRSADWSEGVVLVNGHRGNAAAVQRATTTLTAEGRRVLAWWPATDGDAHAGDTETSLLLAIDAGCVRTDRMMAGRLEPLSQLAEDLRQHGVRHVSPSGVLGDPRTADATRGRALLTRLGLDLVAAVDEWRG